MARHLQLRREPTWLALTTLVVLGSCGGGDEANSPVPQVQPPPPPPPPPPVDAVIFKSYRFASPIDEYLIRPDGTGLASLAHSAQGEKFFGVVGGRVVIQRDGDIYSMAPDGTDSRPVLNSPEVEIVVSSFDDRVIYLLGPDVDNSNLHIVALDGSNDIVLTATTGRKNVSALVGNRILYNVGASDLFSVLADGTGTAPLAATDAVESFRATLDERVIYENSDGAGDLFAVNADGTGRVALATTPESEHVFGIAGDRVIYRRAGNLMSVRIDGSGEVALDTGPFEGNLAGIVGDRVVYNRIIGGGYDIYSIRVDGTDARAIAATGSKELFKAGLGNRVIYSCAVDAIQNWDLCAVDNDGANPVVLANFWRTEEFAGIVGERIIYHRHTLFGIVPTPDIFQFDIVSVNPDGTGTAMLAESPDFETFAGSSGGRILYERITNGQIDLYAVDPDGTNAIVLANSANDEKVIATVAY